MSRVLVTGGAGFIGSHLVDLLLLEGDEIAVLDDLSTGDLNNLDQKKIKFFNGDIRDKKILLEALKGVDIVFHLAAVISVQESLDNPRKYFEINTIGTLNLLECAVESKASKIIYLNSASIYESNEKEKTNESMPLNPLNPYAISKLDGEYLIKMFCKSSGMNYCVLRVFNPYGNRQNENGAISIFLNRALGNADINIFGDGKQIRDFIHVTDVARAACLCKSKGAGVYNVGRGEGISLKELIEKIVHITGSNSKIVYKEGQKGEVRYSVADIPKINRDLKWQPSVSLEAGVKQMIIEANKRKEKELCLK